MSGAPAPLLPYRLALESLRGGEVREETVYATTDEEAVDLATVWFLTTPSIHRLRLTLGAREVIALDRPTGSRMS